MLNDPHKPGRHASNQEISAMATKNKTSKPENKTACPITKDQFRSKAPRDLPVTINGKPLSADIKEFATGSLGWYLNGKITVEIDGVPCTVQIGMNATIVGSKELESK